MAKESQTGIPDSKKKSVAELVQRLTATASVMRSTAGLDTPRPTGPFYTFLLGSGFSISAGVPGTGHLVAALEKYKENVDRAWGDIFEETKALNPRLGCDMTEYYARLLGEVCPQAPARHAFITAAIQWAASKKVQMSLESIHLASILIAGTGREIDLDPQRTSLRWLARAFARHAFTTNFDEVLPTTFYLGGQPVEIIDGPSPRGTSAAAEYPTVVYLHGRHLHYDLRNTPDELKRERTIRTPEVREPFDLFRDLMRSTGLIVIGYSGAEDRVMDCIARALDDESLPYDLYWATYEDENAISKEARQLIMAHDRAFYLEVGKKAAEVLSSLSAQVGIDTDQTIARWSKKTEFIGETVGHFLSSTSYKFRQFLAQAAESTQRYSSKAGKGLLDEWTGKLCGEAATLRDNQLRAQILGAVSELQRLYGTEDNAEKAALDALELHRKVRDDIGAGNDIRRLSDVLLRQGRVDEAEKAAREALELHRKAGSDLGAAHDLGRLSNGLLRQGRVDDAEKAAREALELHRKVGDDLGAANDLRRLSDVLLRKGRVDEAEKAAGEALELHRKVGDDLGAANDLGRLSDVLLRKGRLDEAEKMAREALELHRKVGSDLGAAYDFKAISEVFLAKGAQGKAREFLDEAKVRFANAPDAECRLELGILEGRLLIQLGRKETAREKLGAVRDEAQTLGFALISADAQKYLDDLK